MRPKERMTDLRWSAEIDSSREVARRVFRAAGFGVLTLIAGTGVATQISLVKSDQKKSDVRDGWSGAWSRALIKLFRVDLRVDGEPGARGVGRGHGRVVVANHRSIIDITVMLSQFGGAVLSRGDMERWPIMGRAARAAGTIFVDRKSKKSGAKAIRAMVDRLEAKDTICLFPEGTTFEDDEVRPFKLGGFVAATRANVPVIPVAIIYPVGSGAAFGGETFMHHLSRLAATKATRVRLEIGEEMRANEGEDVEAFAERCRAEVARLTKAGRAKDARP